MTALSKTIAAFGLAALLGCGGQAAANGAAARSDAPTGVLRITKYPGNYAAFKIETPEGVVIILDPYAMNEDVRPDIVTVSHLHEDHMDSSRLVGRYRGSLTPNAFTEAGIAVTGVAGHHNLGDTSVTNIIHVFNLGTLRIAHFASQGEMPTPDMFRQIGRADILIIQMIGTGGKLDAADAAEIARRVGAKIIIPAHGDPQLTPTLCSLLGVQGERIETGILELDPAEVAAIRTPRVIDLDRAEAQ